MSKTAKEGVSLTKFGEILVQLRQEKHLSQAELGHIIYVSGGTISNYEKGVHYPDVEKLVRLADYFNVSIDYLLGLISIKHMTVRIRSKLPVSTVIRSLPPTRWQQQIRPIWETCPGRKFFVILNCRP